MMTRDQAVEQVKSHVGNKNLIKHMLATEAVMKRLAVHFDEDVASWGLAGLLHDLDYDQTAEDFDNHGKLTVRMLADQDLSEEILHAIQSHPGHLPRNSRMDKALYAADPITGLIVAAALMHPTRKLANLDLKFR